MEETFCLGTVVKCSPRLSMAEPFCWMACSACWVDLAGLSTTMPRAAPGDLGVLLGELSLSVEASDSEFLKAASELKLIEAVPAPVRTHLGPGRHSPTPGILRELREPVCVRSPPASAPFSWSGPLTDFRMSPPGGDPKLGVGAMVHAA
jgi:hypothetical protein